jgi:hypothetical protein
LHQDVVDELRLRTRKNMANIGLFTSLWNDRLQININYRMVKDIAEKTSDNVDDYDILDLSVTL